MIDKELRADSGQTVTQPPSIAAVAVMTAGRSSLLQRALESYITSVMSVGRDLEFLVFDDSKNANERSASLRITHLMKERFGVPMRFAGPDERARYTQQLAGCSEVPIRVLEYALLENSGYTLGQNRNALIMDTIGSLVFAADDDTVCAPIAIDDDPDEQISLCSNADPCEYWCFPDFMCGRSQTNLVTTDFLAAHENVLGRSAQNLNLKALTTSPPQSEVTRRIAKPESQIKITINGLLGDCAWGTPFGFWHEPMGYLAFTGASLERLTVSAPVYSESILSRQILRITPNPIVSDVSFSMLTFWSFDNREYLPPNLPSHRGQDLIFGQTLWLCFQEALVGHIPLALVHDPVPSRRFWVGEMQRSAAGVDLCRIVVEAIKLCGLNSSSIRKPALRLKALGEFFIHLAKLPSHLLAETLTDCLFKSNQRLEALLTRKVAELNGRASYFSDDVFRYLKALRKAQNRIDYWLPLDLFSPSGPAEVENRLREIFTKFGMLIFYWEEIIAAARLLRERGIRLTKSV